MEKMVPVQVSLSTGKIRSASDCFVVPESHATSAAAALAYLKANESVLLESDEGLPEDEHDGSSWYEKLDDAAQCDDAEWSNRVTVTLESGDTCSEEV